MEQFSFYLNLNKTISDITYTEIRPSVTPLLYSTVQLAPPRLYRLLLGPMTPYRHASIIVILTIMTLAFGITCFGGDMPLKRHLCSHTSIVLYLSVTSSFVLWFNFYARAVIQPHRQFSIELLLNLQGALSLTSYFFVPQ